MLTVKSNARKLTNLEQHQLRSTENYLQVIGQELSLGKRGGNESFGSTPPSSGLDFRLFYAENRKVKAGSRRKFVNNQSRILGNSEVEERISESVVHVPASPRVRTEETRVC